MYFAEDAIAKRAELVAAATAMMDGRINLIEGVRKITTLRHDMENPDDEAFLPLRAIESETDHFPLGIARAHYTPDYLKQADEEMERYLFDAKADILAACREIIRIFDRSSADIDTY